MGEAVLWSAVTLGIDYPLINDVEWCPEGTLYFSGNVNGNQEGKGMMRVLSDECF